MNRLGEWLTNAVWVIDKVSAFTRRIFDQAHRALRVWIYRLGPKTMASVGYAEFREAQILSAIGKKTITASKIPDGFGIGLDERIVEYPWVFSRIKPGAERLLDAGSVLNFDAILRRPELQSKHIFISTLAPEPNNFWWRRISYTYEDLRHASFRDEYFDKIVCLSTIEHVGMDNTAYKRGVRGENPERQTGDAHTFLMELHRMLKPGGTLLLSFPFGKKAQHSWLQVFDSSDIEKMASLFQPHIQSASYFRYTQQGWKPCMPEQAANATYNHTRDPANPIAAAEAVACLEWVK